MVACALVSKGILGRSNASMRVCKQERVAGPAGAMHDEVQADILRSGLGSWAVESDSEAFMLHGSA